MKWAFRILAITLLVAVSGLAAWVLWPCDQPSEQELLHLVPDNAAMVVVQRDLASHWTAFRHTAFFQAWQDSPWMPAALHGSSLAQRTSEKLVLGLVGQRVVCFVPSNTEGACVLVPLTPHAKWVWLLAKVVQHWNGAGFSIHDRVVADQTVSDVTVRDDPDMHFQFARLGNALAFSANRSGDPLGGMILSARSRSAPESGDWAATNSAAFQLGICRHPSGTATWSLSSPQADRLRLEWTLPVRHVVRLPWDATRGPHSMALIQKLFPDQGVFTMRGRVSHWMGAWDNLVAWVGMPESMFSENILQRLKYTEHLSHGEFPWSGAGDEMACVIGPAVVDTPTGWPNIVAALRCWQTNDTQVALDQFLTSLSDAAHDRIWADKIVTPDREWYAVRAIKGDRMDNLFYYRYASGLVIAANSEKTLQQIDPSQFANPTLKSVQPENQLYCKAGEVASALQAIGTWEQFTGNEFSSRDLNSLISILKTLPEFRLTVQVEKHTIVCVAEVTSS